MHNPYSSRCFGHGVIGSNMGFDDWLKSKCICAAQKPLQYLPHRDPAAITWPGGRGTCFPPDPPSHRFRGGRRAKPGIKPQQDSKVWLVPSCGCSFRFHTIHARTTPNPRHGDIVKVSD
ncbi:uncharacterized protein BDZ83DRAFT_402817 [Colletotrichum acutatum]|uniref:Uncharacterized protein n=1 Tax=Glomerella acutata TaxID=27357 RepID=A0AAD9D289_GLOAC|nr:uncharacterized protein BDZ83DRAFT_402817 [Colletotrichum acutatum]KAK1730361.1 hypothetical protein BDZ83DRAFT_402817 [Colletotrichum acutatum]